MYSNIRTRSHMAEKKNWFDQERSKDEISEPLKEYDISSTPNDFNINTIFDFIESGVVEIPGFQRNYVWDKRRASKLIESLIIGIPVPQIFLFEAAKNKYYVIDGQQRLMTIYYFKKQRFPKKEMRAKLRRIFNEKGKIPDNIKEINISIFNKLSIISVSRIIPNYCGVGICDCCTRSAI